MIPEAVVKCLRDLCDEAYDLLDEENRHLRATGELPSEDLLQRKRHLLPLIEEALERLRALREGKQPLSREASESLLAAQKKLLRIFMLDRENERLLLKAGTQASLRARDDGSSPAFESLFASFQRGTIRERV